MKNCGSVGFSLDRKEDIERLKAAITINGFDKSRFTIQVVVGATEEWKLEQILDAADEAGFHVLLLGYKTTGRGASVIPHQYDWTEVVKRLKNEDRLPTLGIDTALAAGSIQQLTAMGIPSWMYTTKEGAFSCYVDAVEMKIGPSSYGDPSEMVPLVGKDPKKNPAPEHDQILAAFESFQK